MSSLYKQWGLDPWVPCIPVIKLHAILVQLCYPCTIFTCTAALRLPTVQETAAQSLRVNVVVLQFPAQPDGGTAIVQENLKGDAALNHSQVHKVMKYPSDMRISL